MSKKICVLGMGYIGLPTSIMFASNGFEVVGVDIDKRAVEAINEGRPHIEEPGLAELLPGLVSSGKLKASLKPEVADIFIIAVPTPITQDLKAELSYVEQASKDILPYIKKGDIISVESTISPGTTDHLVAPILAKSGLDVHKDLYIAHCPERVLPGQILHELVYNNRIIGGINETASEKVAEVYRAFVKGDIILADAKAAEMAKLMENTFRDVNIALANELAKVCNYLGIDALKVIELSNRHPRVNIHQPGPGVGGHCLAVDPYFIIEQAPHLARIMALSRETNRSMPDFVVDKVTGLTAGIFNPQIAVLGITYKGNVDDVRESPALEIIEMLKEKGFSVRVCDPHVEECAPLELVSIENALQGADCALILADHNEFKILEPQRVLSLMKTPIIFDTKNWVGRQIYDESKIVTVNYGNIAKIIAEMQQGMAEAAAAKEQ